MVFWVTPKHLKKKHTHTLVHTKITQPMVSEAFYKCRIQLSLSFLGEYGRGLPSHQLMGNSAAGRPSPTEMHCDFEEGGSAAGKKPIFCWLSLSISYLYLYECC